MLAAFAFFDKDGSGYITFDELQQACKDFGLSDAQLEDMIKEIDQDNVSVHIYSLMIDSYCRLYLTKKKKKHVFNIFLFEKCN